MIACFSKFYFRFSISKLFIKPVNCQHKRSLKLLYRNCFVMSSKNASGSSSLSQFNPLPKLVVFDLDYTLWPYWVDTHIGLPIKKLSNGTVEDSRGTKLRIFPEVVEVLQTLKDNNIQIAAASRTQEPPAARDMLNYFDLDKFFDYKEIYPGEKDTHFHKIKSDSKVPLEDMLFFDDEDRNIITVSKLKVTCFLVEKEVNMKTLHAGLSLFAEKNQSRK